MSALSQFSGAPAKVTEYTSGSGTFTPINTTNTYARITLVGAGGGGGRGTGGSIPGGGGGGAGQAVVYWIKLTAASYAYAVGAGGNGATTDNTNGANGGHSNFGLLYAQGGRAGNQWGEGGYGGGVFPDGASFSGSAIVVNGSGVNTLGGGGGHATNATAGQPGHAAGYANPKSYLANNIWPTIAANGTNLPGERCGGGGGGSSLYGTGGAGGNASNTTATAGANATGYGGGGGGGGGGGVTSGNGGNGTGGYILIEEFAQ